MSGVGVRHGSDGRGVRRTCEPDFRAAAFEDWVPRFAMASRALSAVGGAAGADEIAAYRGFFARRSPGAANVAMLQAYLCPQASGGEPMLGKIAALLAEPLSPDESHAAFLRLAPFALGNRRCARALRMSRGLAQGDTPEADPIWTEWAQAREAGRASARRQFTRMPQVPPYVIQTFGSA